MVILVGQKILLQRSSRAHLARAAPAFRRLEDGMVLVACDGVGGGAARANSNRAQGGVTVGGHAGAAAPSLALLLARACAPRLFDRPPKFEKFFFDLFLQNRTAVSPG